MPPDWSRTFRVHIDASQLAIGPTLTQLDDDKGDRAIAYTSRKLTASKQNYATNEREILGLIFALQRFSCYLEGSAFDVFTDNQVVENFLANKSLNQREARWLDVLRAFNIRKIDLVSGKMHVLGDSLSRIPNHPVIQQIQLVTPTFSELEDVSSKYDADQLFGPIVATLEGQCREEPKQRRIELLLPSFSKNGWRLLYHGKLCVPLHCRRQVLEIAHDSKVVEHLAFSKTLARLAEFHWKHKTRDVKRYCDICGICQQQKDFHGQILNDHTPLLVTTRRRGLVATDFIVKLPKTDRGFDTIATWVDRFSRRIRFVTCKETIKHRTSRRHSLHTSFHIMYCVIPSSLIVTRALFLHFESLL